MGKPKWKKEMEDFVNGMSDEEWEQFKIDTNFDYYNSEHFQNMSRIYPQWLQDLTAQAEKK